jgi:hypothetical protein
LCESQILEVGELGREVELLFAGDFDFVLGLPFAKHHVGVANQLGLLGGAHILKVNFFAINQLLVDVGHAVPVGGEELLVVGPHCVQFK